MTETRQHILALDVGERRIGIAVADTETKVPAPLTTLEVDGLEIERLRQLIAEKEIALLVVGLPRNQSGDETAQTAKVREFAEEKLANLGAPILFQDESLTSVMAEDYLKGQRKKDYTKGDIDMYAAAIILGDYLEANYGHPATQTV